VGFSLFVGYNLRMNTTNFWMILGVMLSFLSPPAQAGENLYHCSLENYYADLSFVDQPSGTTLYLYDDDYQTITNAFATTINVSALQSTYHFFTSTGETKVTFMNTDLATFPDHFVAFVDSNSTGVYLYDKLFCTKDGTATQPSIQQLPAQPFSH
jgi:hypothetical protein